MLPEATFLPPLLAVAALPLPTDVAAGCRAGSGGGLSRRDCRDSCRYLVDGAPPLLAVGLPAPVEDAELVLVLVLVLVLLLLVVLEPDSQRVVVGLNRGAALGARWRRCCVLLVAVMVLARCWCWCWSCCYWRQSYCCWPAPRCCPWPRWRRCWCCACWYWCWSCCCCWCCLAVAGGNRIAVGLHRGAALGRGGAAVGIGGGWRDRCCWMRWSWWLAVARSCCWMRAGAVVLPDTLLPEFLLLALPPAAPPVPPGAGRGRGAAVRRRSRRQAVDEADCASAAPVLRARTAQVANRRFLIPSFLFLSPPLRRTP